MKNRKQVPIFLYLIALFLLLYLAMNAFDLGRADMSYSDIVELFETQQVKSFTVSGNTIFLELHTPVDGETELRERLADPETFRAEMSQLFREQKEQGILESYEFLPEEGFTRQQSHEWLYPGPDGAGCARRQEGHLPGCGRCRRGEGRTG